MKKLTKKNLAELEYTLELASFQITESEENLLKIVEATMTALANLNPELTIKIIKNLNDTEIDNLKKMIATNKQLKTEFIDKAVTQIPDYLKLENE